MEASTTTMLNLLGGGDNITDEDSTAIIMAASNESTGCTVATPGNRVDTLGSCANGDGLGGGDRFANSDKC